MPTVVGASRLRVKFRWGRFFKWIVSSGTVERGLAYCGSDRDNIGRTAVSTTVIDMARKMWGISGLHEELLAD